MTKYLVMPVLLGLAVVLTATQTAQAQVRVVVGVGGRGPAYYPRSYYPYSYPSSRYYYPGPAIIVGAPPVVYGSPPVVVREVYAPPAVEAPPANIANIRVMVPDPQAKVWFDGTLTTQGGTDRLYRSPPLTGGGPYSYRIRASWVQNGKEMVQEAVAAVTPGQTTTIDFTRPYSEAVPLPK